MPRFRLSEARFSPLSCSCSICREQFSGRGGGGAAGGRRHGIRPGGTRSPAFHTQSAETLRRAPPRSGRQCRGGAEAVQQCKQYLQKLCVIDLVVPIDVIPLHQLARLLGCRGRGRGRQHGTAGMRWVLVRSRQAGEQQQSSWDVELSGNNRADHTGGGWRCWQASWQRCWRRCLLQLAGRHPPDMRPEAPQASATSSALSVPLPSCNRQARGQ
jgi:hypothetical protein